MSITRLFFAWPYVLSDRHPVICWSRDAVEINREKGATTENQGADVKYMSKEVYVDIVDVI